MSTSQSTTSASSTSNTTADTTLTNGITPPHLHSHPQPDTDITPQSIIDELNVDEALNDITDASVLSSSLDALHLQNGSAQYHHHHNSHHHSNHTTHHESFDDLDLLVNSRNAADHSHTTPLRPVNGRPVPLLDTDDVHTNGLHQRASTMQRSNSNLDLETPTQRQLTRRALNASIDRANQFKSSSSIARFSVNTVDKLTPTFVKGIAVNKWKAYGEPLVTYLDANIDRAVNLIDSTGFLPQTIQAMTSPMQIPASSPAMLSNDKLFLNTSASATSATSAASLSGGDSGNESSSLDSQLDRHTQLMLLDKDARTMYQQYWERLKEKFVASAWYGKVDDILLQNPVVRAFSNRLGDWQRPAEVFYNTVTEEFMSHGTYDDFLAALTAKLGPAWDDRLAPLAKGFFTTAKAVSALVGAGKFVGGALQLGKAKVHSAIDDLLAKWDRVLGLTDNMIDRYLPEREHELQPPMLMSGADSGKRRREHHMNVNGSSDDFSDFSTSDDDDSDLDASGSDSDDSKHSHVFDMDIEEKTNGVRKHSDSSESSQHTNGVGRKRGNDHLLYISASDDDSETLASLETTSLDRERSVPGIALKLNKRIRQRIPSISSGITSVTSLPGKAVDAYADELKQVLTDNGWFATVDQLLMQNMFVKALASFIRPAEHFFNTSLHLYQRRVSADVAHKQHNDRRKHSSTASAAAASSAAAAVAATQMQSNGSDTTSSSTDNHVDTVNGDDNTSTSSTSSTASTPTREPSPEVVEDFVVHLRDAMGASWDERLVQPAVSFLSSAIQLRTQFSAPVSAGLVK